MTGNGGCDSGDAHSRIRSSGNAQSPRPRSPSRPDADSPDPLPRHYPVDIPDAPFHRYDHRFTVRDIMVHRIMADFMNPARVVPKSYDAHVARGAAFKLISSQDKGLGADLRCVQKMLFTSHADVPARLVDYPVTEAVVSVGGPSRQPASQGEQIIDLVRRHYFEADSAILRAWISHLGHVPAHAPGPRTHTQPRSWRYNVAVSEESKLPFVVYQADTVRFLPHACVKWNPADTSHLLELQPKMAMQHRLHLYNGGLSTPHLRRYMDQDTVGTRRGRRDNKWRANWRGQMAVGSTESFPEENGEMRFVIQPAWGDSHDNPLIHSYEWFLDLSLNPGRGRNTDGIWATGRNVRPRKGEGRHGRPRRRSTSLPPHGTFSVAYIGARAARYRYEDTSRLVILYPHMSLTQLDRRSRRRSLSRTRIEEQFDWDTDIVGITAASTTDTTTGLPGKPTTMPDFPKMSTAEEDRHRCQNCATTTHRTADCEAPCGHCGAPNPNASLRSSRDLNISDISDSEEEDDEFAPGYEARNGRHQHPHMAPNCPVARHNRCKCLPFPTFHVASRCSVPCHRDCGARSDARPGSFPHRNAMLCRSRCCMCGLRGHSGKECRLRRCRCGGAHLGQDCGWNPTCRVPGCERFLCGLHCRACGSTEKPFVEWRCAQCSPVPVAAEAEMPRGRRRRRNKPEKPNGQERGIKGDEPCAPSVAAGDLCRNETTSRPRTTAAAVTTIEASREDTTCYSHPSIFGGVARVSRDGIAREK